MKGLRRRPEEGDEGVEEGGQEAGGEAPSLCVDRGTIADLSRVGNIHTVIIENDIIFYLLFQTFPVYFNVEE